LRAGKSRLSNAFRHHSAPIRRVGTLRALRRFQKEVSKMSASLNFEEPLRVTLGELISVLSELTEDENEIVATAVHMVDGGRVRLIEKRLDAPET
jgi:hypothetical protein